MRFFNIFLKNDVPNAGWQFRWKWMPHTKPFLFGDRHCCDNPDCLGAAIKLLRSGFTIQIQAQWYQDEPIDPKLVDVFGSPEVPWMLHPTYQSAGGCPDVLQDPRLVEPRTRKTDHFFAKQARCFFDLVQHGKEKNGWGFWYSRNLI